MADAKTSISLNWDGTGRVHHKVTGTQLAPPRNDSLLWLVAPSGAFLLANQLGVLRPSYGLIASAHALDICEGPGYLLRPIGNTLKSARIEYVYQQGGSLGVLFFPQHSIFANNDSLEEGMRQLVSNNLYSVLEILEPYFRLPVKTMTYAVVDLYCDFLNEALTRGAIGVHSDRWTIEFSFWCKSVIASLSPKYYVPDPGQDDWFRSQSKFLAERSASLRRKHADVSKRMGLR